MLRVADVSELAYGGLVTGMAQWDKKRVEDGKIEEKELFKKASFYTYLIPGLFCTTATAFGWMRGWDAYNERIAHGFIYGFPGFVLAIINAFSEGGAGAKSAAVREAERLLAEGRRSTAGKKTAGWRPQGIIA